MNTSSYVQLKRVFARLLIISFLTCLIVSCDYITIKNPFFDINPPTDVTNLTATTEFNEIKLSWKNPEDNDFAGCMVMYGADNDIMTKYTGEINPENTVIEGLNKGTEYNITIYSVDTAGNQSEGKNIKIATLGGYFRMGGTIDGESIDVETVEAKIRIEETDPPSENQFNIIVIYDPLTENGIKFGPISRFKSNSTYDVVRYDVSFSTEEELMGGVTSHINYERYGYTTQFAHSTNNSGIIIENYKDKRLRGNFSISETMEPSFNVMGSFDIKMPK